MIKAISKTIYFIIISSLLFINCASIESIRDPNFKKDILKIFIYTKTIEKFNDIMSQVSIGLENKLKEYNIVSNQFNDISGNQPLSLENKDNAIEIIKRFSESGSDVMLTVIQTKCVFYNNLPSGGTYELQLISTGLGKPVWKAKLEFNLSEAGYPFVGILASKIIDKMDKDGLISKKP